MPRSTTLLAGASFLLFVALGLVWWFSWRITAEGTPEVNTTGVPVGLAEGEAKPVDPDIGSQSTLWWDSEADVIRFEQNGFEQRPIASITKLMTAMVALDYGIDWDQEMDILPDEYTVGGKLLLHPGEHVTMRDLWHASLIGSANNATYAYVRGLGVDIDEFVLQMNRKAIELSLEQTTFVEVTGLDKRNVSTAYEVARLAEASWQQYPEIAQVTSMTEYSYVVGGSGREHTIRNTDKLITEQNYLLRGSKTGYLYEAGFCLVIRGDEENGRHIVVAMGAPSEWDVLEDTKALLSKTLK